MCINIAVATWNSRLFYMDDHISLFKTKEKVV